MSSDDFDARVCALANWFAATTRKTSGTFVGSDANATVPENSSPITVSRQTANATGIAVVASHTIAAQATLVTVGRPDILSLKTSEVHKRIPRKELGILPPWLGLVLALFYEYGQGSDSRWWPYMNLLPSHFDTLMHWSEGELKELIGSHVLAKIGTADAEEAFNDLLFPVLREHFAVFGSLQEVLSDPDESTSQHLVASLAHRFATLVSMDSIDLDDDNEEGDAESDEGEDGLVEDKATKGMMPYVNLIRSDPQDANVQLVYNDNGSVSITALRQINPGSELIQSPGEMPNSELLRCYGIVAGRENPHDVVELDLETLSMIAKQQGLSESQVRKRESLADRWDVLDDGYDLLKSPGINGIDPDLLLVTTLLASKGDAEIQELKNNKEKPASVLDRGNANLLLHACEDKQRRYLTTIAEDIALLGRNGENTQNLSRRKLLAVVVRLGEKQVLAENADYIRNFLSDGGALEESQSRDPKRLKS